MTGNIKKSIYSLIYNCAYADKNSKGLIVSDSYTKEIGDLIKKVAEEENIDFTHLVIEPFKIHGEEPSKEIAQEMLKYDIVFGLTKMSMAHSKARLEFSNRGGKYLSLPDYSMDVLVSPALQYDFRSLIDISSKIAALMTNGKQLRILSQKGTDLTCDIQGRYGNPAPGCCFAKGIIASPPDAETNIAPIENKSNGVIYVDGSIPCSEIGLVKSDAILHIKDGRVINIEGKYKDTLNKLFDHVGEKARVVAEIGIGLNPLAKLCGSMLEDEGCLGTAHVGIGANATIGGKNSVPFHLDHIMKDVTLYIDNEMIIEDGKILLY
jgi:2,5-dihydroxypyridine 5,6-dioxygenase